MAASRAEAQQPQGAGRAHDPERPQERQHDDEQVGPLAAHEPCPLIGEREADDVLERNAAQMNQSSATTVALAVSPRSTTTGASSSGIIAKARMSSGSSVARSNRSSAAWLRVCRVTSMIVTSLPAPSPTSLVPPPPGPPTPL